MKKLRLSILIVLKNEILMDLCLYEYTYQSHLYLNLKFIQFSYKQVTRNLLNLFLSSPYFIQLF